MFLSRFKNPSVRDFRTVLMSRSIDWHIELL